MPLSITPGPKDPLTEAADALVVCVFAQGLAEHATVAAANKALGGALLDHAKSAEFEGKLEQTLEVPGLGRLRARRLILVGAGPEAELTPARLRAVVAHAVRVGSSQNAERIVLVAPSQDVTLREVGEGAALGAYRFTKYFTGERKPKRELERIAINLPASAIDAAGKKALATGTEIGAAVAIARDAVNEPPNVVVPEALARIAREIAKAQGLKVKVLDKAGIQRAGMNLHYAVGQGSSNEPRFIHLTYTPRTKKKVKRLVFVGKGLTFDSGGLCIKPAPGMGDMKSDMGGAAAVLGLMSAIAALQVPVEVHGIIGAAENMPDGSAYRPADIFTSLEGKTVEIINTDAEGRLVLADALTYAARLKPDVIVDAATLTGAALVALGKSYSAYYTADGALAKQFAAAAAHAGEGFWQMPLIDELAEQLKSDVADLKHTGDRYGGSITAALFLREFVGKVPWIHCDIAGPVLSERARGTSPKGATGHAVLTFVRFVEAFSG